MNQKVKILNIEIDNYSLEEVLSLAKEGVLLTPNVDDLIKNQTDYNFHCCYKRANYIICDSKLVLLFSRILGTPLKEAIPGSDFFPAYYNYHRNNNNVSIFLLGAKEGVGELARVKINNRIGREIIVGSYSPPFGFEYDEKECQNIINVINFHKPTTLVVGLGNPKQTNWIFKYKEYLPSVKLFMALGATIDFEAGTITRAPKIFQFLYLEWFYRMIKEPRRLVKRYLIDDLPIFKYITLQLLGKFRDPFAEE